MLDEEPCGIRRDAKWWSPFVLALGRGVGEDKMTVVGRKMKQSRPALVLRHINAVLDGKSCEIEMYS